MGEQGSWRGTTLKARVLALTAVLTVSLSARSEEPVLKSPCEGGLRRARDEILGGARSASSPLDGKVFADAPESVKLFSDQYASTVEVLWAIPTSTSEYRKVYNVASGGETKATKALQIKRYKKEYQKEFGVKGRLVGRKEFDAALAHDRTSIFAIIGHNENGRFRFLDGATANLNELADSCTAKMKLCVFVSCDSNEFIASKGVGVDRSITATEARWITREIRTFLSKREMVTPNEMVEFVRAQSAKAKTKHRVVYVAQKGCGATSAAVAIALVVCTADDDMCGLESHR